MLRIESTNKTEIVEYDTAHRSKKWVEPNVRYVYYIVQYVCTQRQRATTMDLML